MKINILLSVLFLFAHFAVGQVKEYSLPKLTQETVIKGNMPVPALPKESGDTSYTIFKGSSVDMKLYFVNGSQYNNIFNPNPTGIYLNAQHFRFFCDIDRSLGQSLGADAFLEMYEFAYLGSKYLCLINFRTDCNGKGCQYKCYNVFDISKPEKIIQVSFSSTYVGSETFGDFNYDGAMDFVRVHPKAPEKQKYTPDCYIVNAYNLTANGVANPLKNPQGQLHYIFAKSQNEMQTFKVIQHDWMRNLNDSTGKAIEKPVAFFEPYEPFDPKVQYLYDSKGTKVEKLKWALSVKNFTDVGGAQQFCAEMGSLKTKEGDNMFNEIFIMTDQYGGNINFIVFVGNYNNKEQAQRDFNFLKTLGFEPKWRDLKSAY